MTVYQVHFIFEIVFRDFMGFHCGYEKIEIPDSNRDYTELRIPDGIQHISVGFFVESASKLGFASIEYLNENKIAIGQSRCIQSYECDDIDVEICIPNRTKYLRIYCSPKLIDRQMWWLT